MAAQPHSRLRPMWPSSPIFTRKWHRVFSQPHAVFGLPIAHAVQDVSSCMIAEWQRDPVISFFQQHKLGPNSALVPGVAMITMLFRCMRNLKGDQPLSMSDCEISTALWLPDSQQSLVVACDLDRDSGHARFVSLRGLNQQQSLRSPCEL